MHFKQACYMAMIYARNFHNIQNLSSPEYGWKYDSTNKCYKPVMIQNLSASIAVINFVKCNWQKECSKWYSCQKSALSRIEMCRSIDFECQNTHKIETDIHCATLEDTERTWMMILFVLTNYDILVIDKLIDFTLFTLFVCFFLKGVFMPPSLRKLMKSIHDSSILANLSNQIHSDI